MVSSLFDVTKQVIISFQIRIITCSSLLQLTFYGSYHANKTNILIHMLCLPLLVWFVPLHIVCLITP